MLFYNNLLINLSDKKMLINLISFRRRLLSDTEAELVKSMIKKDKDGVSAGCSNPESCLYDKLVEEAQIIPIDKQRFFESEMEKCFLSLNPETSNNEITIQLTERCNMNCIYCYQHNLSNNGKTMTLDDIHKIKEFLEGIERNTNIDFDSTVINLTGGECLLNRQMLELINQSISLWPNSKFTIATNGVNICKFFNDLPLDRISEIFVSLDGVKEIHLDRCFMGQKPDESIYISIIDGIKSLLQKGIRVCSTAVIDKTNYQNVPIFLDYLKTEGLFDSPLFRVRISPVLDFNDSLVLNHSFNNVEELVEILNYLQKNTHYYVGDIYPPLARLSSYVYRDFDTRVDYKFIRCRGNTYYFHPNGKAYFCTRQHDNIGAVGTYRPELCIDYDAIEKHLKRNVFALEKCKVCIYKFVCSGGCPLVALLQEVETNCSIFAQFESIDNLVFKVTQADYQRMFKHKPIPV